MANIQGMKVLPPQNRLQTPLPKIGIRPTIDGRYGGDGAESREGAEGPDGRGLHHDRDETFDVLRAWETDRGPQHFHYDAWWHLNQNVLVSSEWGTPSMIENGLVPELLLGQKYGHSLHFWDLAEGRNLQTVDLGAEQQMVLELLLADMPEQGYKWNGDDASPANGRSRSAFCCSPPRGVWQSPQSETWLAR